MDHETHISRLVSSLILIASAAQLFEKKTKKQLALRCLLASSAGAKGRF